MQKAHVLFLYISCVFKHVFLLWYPSPTTLGAARHLHTHTHILSKNLMPTTEFLPHALPLHS